METEEFPQEFPEQYNYQLLDSFKLAIAAGFIQAELMTNLCGSRHLVPGLRKALRLIYATDQCNH